MRVRVMTNPAQLLLAGNPGRKKRRGGKAWHKKMMAAKAAKAAAASTPSKEHPVAKRRKKKSKASRAHRIAKRRARRSHRRAKRAAHTSAPKRRRRRSRKASMKRHSRKARAHRKAYRKARRSRRTRHLALATGQKVVIRKRRHARGKLRVSRRRGRRGVKVGVNAGSLSLTGGLTHFLANAKATMHDGVKGFAFALAGAGVSVAGGAFTSQVTGNLLGRFAPSLLTNPIVARVLGAVNYYLPGWLASKYIPGLSGKSRRAMLTGAAAAAIVEVIRPGMVRQTLSSIPVVGGFLSGMEDQAADLGAYVGYALNGTGSGDSSGYAGTYDANPGAGSGELPMGNRADPGVGDYVALGDYFALGEYANVSSDAVANILH